MRRVYGSLLVTAAILASPFVSSAQDEVSRKIAGGGISAAGWMGKIDAKEAATGATLSDSKLTGDAKKLMVFTGPATTYWSPANMAKGDYTVKATFDEPKFMDRSGHPHPYGIVIGGNDMGTDAESFLYCSAYGNGTFIVRGMGPAPFMMNGGRGGANDAVHKAEKGAPVQQMVAMSVKGDKVSCSINGAEVWSATKAELVTAGKLKSTDGMFGVRFAHNTEATVTGLT
ncbi:MAG: hypothetical protein ABI120_26105, partial [Gemmatimonadaceae bacterium]